MCEWETEDVLLQVTVPETLSHTGAAFVKVVGIDACIAPIVRALNAGGVLTASSCCGHGAGLGTILLHDGRVLLVAPNLETAQNLEALYPVALNAVKTEGATGTLTGTEGSMRNCE